MGSCVMPSLAAELLEQPRQKANHLPKLIASLGQPDESVASTVHSLRLFFLGAFERGELSGGRASDPAPGAQQQQSPEAMFSAWLLRQYSAYVSVLLALLTSGPEARTQVAALGALMECVRCEEAGVFNNGLYGRVLEAAVRGRGVKPEVLGALLSKYMAYADVRYHTLRGIAKIAERRARSRSHASTAAAQPREREESDAEEGQEAGSPGGFVSAHDLARNLCDLLSQAPPFEGGDEGDAAGLQSWCGAAEEGVVAPAADADGSRQRRKRKAAAAAEGGGGPAAQQRAKWASAKLQKKALSDAWMAFLQLDLPDDTYKRVLTRLHDLIIPAVFNPLLLSDFLTHSLDRGGLLGVLALNGIFVLVTRHGLEYPHFYARLYALLTPEVFQAKYRARFFQLADAFLASSMVPAYTAASFAKRFARLALTASPAGALVSLAFIHNILRRHPACQQMLHRPLRQAGGGDGGATGADGATQAAGTGVAGQQAVTGSSSAAGGHATAGQLSVHAGHDVYDPAEPDPAHSRAIESSLWELQALRVHANPMVAGFCSSLDKDLSDRRKTAEVDLVELLPASYASMFSAEAERRIKSVPTAFYQLAPTRLHDANCAADWDGWEM